MARHGVAGQCDHRNILRGAVALQPSRRFPPVDERHRQIHQDQIGLQLLRLFDRLNAILRLGHAKTAELQVLTVHFTSVREIVDDEHERFIFFGHDFFRLAHFFNTIGSIRVNVEPLPSLLSTFNVPRSMAASRLQIDKPRPVPP